MVTLKRSLNNPILSPTRYPWENSVVFNPAAILIDSKTYLFYRAMGVHSYISRFGIAESYDGVHFLRHKTPMFSGFQIAADGLGVEDPRVVQIEGTFYFVYAAVSQDKTMIALDGVPDSIVRIPVVAIAATTDFKKFTNEGITLPTIIGKDASLFPRKINGEYWLLYREGVDKTYFIKSKNLNNWSEKQFVFDKRPGYWDSVRVGIGGPPIETEKGWLLFYHGFDEQLVYRIGIMFLDLNDPTKVIYRSPFFILEPEEPYEKQGLVPNVIFTCGTVEKDGVYYVYYGAADKYVGLATINKSEVLSLL